jgi:hypothetical protein
VRECVAEGQEQIGRKTKMTVSKGKWNDAPMAALTILISGCDTF